MEEASFTKGLALRLFTLSSNAHIYTVIEIHTMAQLVLIPHQAVVWSEQGQGIHPVWTGDFSKVAAMSPGRGYFGDSQVAQ